MGQKKKLLIFLLILFLNVSSILASPELKNIGFTSNDGSGKILMEGNLTNGFVINTNGNPSTDYFIQFADETRSNEKLKDEMFPLFLVNSSVPVSELKNYYDNGGVPEPFLSYLKNASDGITAFAYINGSTLRINDGAHYNLLPDYSDMIVPGDYPTGVYDVQGEIKNKSGDIGIVKFRLIIGITIENETEASCVFDKDNISLSANLNGADIDSVWFSYIINGTNYNKTASNIGENTYQITIPSSELIFGNLTWKVYAKGTAGRIDVNEEKTFYVIKSTYLSMFPSAPDGLNGWYVTAPEFRLLKDSIGGDTYYRWDSTALRLYTATFGLENIPNPNPITAGILDLNFWTNFGTCGNEKQQKQFIYIDLTNPVIKDLVPANDSKVYGPRPKISAYLDEVYGSNSGINISSIVIRLDGVDITSDSNRTKKGLHATVSYISDSISIGKHEVYVYAKDNAGRSSELNWSFFVETNTTLDMQINSPKSLIYNSKKVLFDINTTAKTNIFYTNYADVKPKFTALCRNCNYYNKSITLHEDWNNLTIKAEDNYGPVKEKNIILFIDSKKPVISKTEPKKNSFTNGSFYMKFAEENPKELSITYNSTKILNLSKCTANGRYKECYYDLNLTEYDGQEIEYSFKLTDIANNAAESKLTKVKVDTTPPRINNLNDSLYKTYRNYAYLKINITELNLDKVEYFDLNDSRARWKTLCTRLTNGICEKRAAFDGTNPNLLLRVLDEAGNAVI